MNAKIVKIVMPAARFAAIYGKRAFHLLMQRRVLRIVGGLSIMYGASVMLQYHPDFVPHMIWESTAYFVHGVGSIPFLQPLEPILAGAKDVEIG